MLNIGNLNPFGGPHSSRHTQSLPVCDWCVTPRQVRERYPTGQRDSFRAAIHTTEACVVWPLHVAMFFWEQICQVLAWTSSPEVTAKSPRGLTSRTSLRSCPSRLGWNMLLGTWKNQACLRCIPHINPQWVVRSMCMTYPTYRSFLIQRMRWVFLHCIESIRI
jgi:hypothetical protein